MKDAADVDTAPSDARRAPTGGTGRVRAVMVLGATFGAFVLMATAMGKAGDETRPAPAGAVQERAAPQRQVMLLDLDFTRDDSAVISCGDAVRVHDVASGRLLQSLTIPALGRCVACSPVARELFAVGANDGTLRLYRIGEEGPVRELKGHGQMVLDAAFSPDGKKLLSSGTVYREGRRAAGDVRLWDVASGELLQSLDFEHFGIACIAYSRDGQHIALARMPAGRDPEPKSTAELYDVQDWRLVRSIPFEPGFGLALAFTPDGSKLLIMGGICVPSGPNSCRPTGKLWVADLAAGGAARPIEVEQSDCFRSGRIAAAGELFATGTAVVRERPNETAMVSLIQMRRLDTGEVVWSRDGAVGASYGVTVSPGGALVAGCTDRQVQILEAGTGEVVRVIEVGE